MRRLLLSVLLIAPSVVAAKDSAPSSTSEDHGPEEPAAAAGSPYLGFAFGGGTGWLTIDGAANRSSGLFAQAKGGAVLTPKLLLDLNASILTVSESYSFPPVEPVLAIRLINIYLAATIFPLDDALFLRAGAGGAWLSATNGFDASPASLSANGLALVGGLGYRVWLSDTADLMFNAEGFLHRYSPSSWRTQALLLSVGLDVYFKKQRRAGSP